MCYWFHLIGQGLLIIYCKTLSCGSIRLLFQYHDILCTSEGRDLDSKSMLRTFPHHLRSLDRMLCTLILGTFYREWYYLWHLRIECMVQFLSRIPSKCIFTAILAWSFFLFVLSLRTHLDRTCWIEGFTQEFPQEP